jgi:serine/threonine protein kinase
MNLLYLTEKDKQNAENERLLLSVLKGPTLIKFVESFNENNCIYIVMEYADQGSLAQKVLKYQT